MASEMNQALRIRIQPEGLRRPAGARRGGKGVGGQYQKYGTPGGRFLIELGDSNGKFEEAHRQLARQTQEQVVKALKAGIKRKSTSSKRLERVTDSPENITASAQGWGVGADDFLNKSEAKYWRTVDEGSLGVWSRPFKGMVFYVARKEAWGAQIVHGKNRSYAVGGFMAAMSGRTTEKLNAISTSRAMEIIDRRGSMPRWMGRMFITREIAPEDYYDKGFAAMGKSMAERRVFSNVLDRIFHGID